MKRKAILLFAGVLAVGLIAAGCDDDDESSDTGTDAVTTAALTKEEYLAQGNQICKQGNAETDAAAQQVFQGGKPTPEEENAFVTDSVVPSIQGQIDKLREGIPEGDEDTVNGFLDDAEAALDQIKADPQLIQADPGPFAEVNQELKAYGLTTCGSG